MIRLSLLFSVLLLLVGCGLQRRVAPEPPVESPSAYLEAAADDTDLPSAEEWWRAFDDAGLDRLMQALFADNLELAQGYARLQQADATLGISRAARYPSLNAAANTSRSLQPGLTEDFTGDSSRLSVAAAYELDLWGRIAAQGRQAEAGLAATRANLEVLYTGLAARLADLYFLVAEQRAQVELAGQVVASYADTARRVERRYRAGLVTSLDLYQARQALAAASSASTLYRSRLAQAEHAVDVLVANYPGAGSWAPPRLPDAPRLFAVGVPAQLLQRRPDLRAALQRVEAADAGVAVAIADRLPSISFSGNYGSLRQEITAGLIKGEFWSLLGNLALPVIDGGRRRAEVTRREGVLAEAVAAYQQAVLSAFRDVEDALAANLATEQRLVRLAESAQAAAETLREATSRYFAGLIDYLPVLAAQRADADARSRLLETRRQLLSDRVSLARALGGAWMSQEIETRLAKEKE
jgi:NodT family efflux transporter outer membrane factor (OMF) lipoprotein